MASMTACSALLYGLEEPVEADRFARLAEPWRPLRTWAVVLIRAAGPRLLAGDAKRGTVPSAA